MASEALPQVPTGSAAPTGAALQHGTWRNRANLSSGLQSIEHFLVKAGVEQGPWAVVAFAAGIAAWFALANSWQWLGLIASGAGLALAALAGLRAEGRHVQLRRAAALLGLALAAGCALVWAKSALVGTEPIARPMIARIDGLLLAREEQPAEQRIRLVLATRQPASGRAIKVRVNLDLERDSPDLTEGARLRLRVRLVPPPPADVARVLRFFT